MTMGKIKKELYTFGKAECTASAASVVDFGLAFLLSDVLMVWYALANAIGVVAGGVTNCCLNYRYVFQHGQRKKRSIAWRYFVVWGVSWALNTFGTFALTEFIRHSMHENLHYFIPKCVVAFLVAVLFNYPAQHHFVFK